MIPDSLYADTLSDVLWKATGQHLSPPEGDLAALARKYKLNLTGLQHLAQHPHQPEGVALPAGLHRIHLPYFDFSVNVWLYQHGSEIILIDAGAEAPPIIDACSRMGLTPTQLLLTHDHPDHSGGLSGLCAHYRLRVTTTQRGITILDTGGHCRQHHSYYLADHGLCFCGDALFAGSMGKANVGYDLSLKSLHTLLDLPAHTLLLPGHGPATTVGVERERNCFYKKA